jgi:hypothetical protein
VVNGTAGGSGIPVSGRAGALAKTLADAGFSKAAASPSSSRARAPSSVVLPRTAARARTMPSRSPRFLSFLRMS